MINAITPKFASTALVPLSPQGTPYRQLADPALTAFELGNGIEDGQPFSLTDFQVAAHMAVLGGSGSGKSKFLELLLRQRLLNGKAFGLWDPHGDLAKSLLAFAAARKAFGDDTLWRKIHYLQLTPECVFSFDPVLNAPRRSDVGDYAYYQWLHVRIDRMWKVLMRRVSEANQDIMVRLRRWMRCVLYACLVAIDDCNTHVGLDKALIFTDPQCDEFPELYDLVEPHLPPRIRRNFEKLMETQRPQDQEKWVESTVNKLEEALSPLTEAVYSQARPSIDVNGIINRGEFLLIDLKENDYFSGEMKLVLGGLLLTEVLATKEAEENVPEDERKEFMIVVDEAGELLGDDLKRALGATRKFKCPIVLGGQDLSTFARGELDMAAKVLTMCNTVVCFQNTYKEDKEILADRIFSGNLDLFTRRMIEVQRQRGDRILQYDELSENVSASENVGETLTNSENHMHAEQIGQAIAIAQNYSHVHNTSDGVVRTENNPNDTRSTAVVRGGTKGGGTTQTNNSSSTQSHGSSSAIAKSKSAGMSQGIVVAHKIVIQPNIVSEFEEDGTLEDGPVELQRAQKEQQIHLLGVGQAAIAVRGLPHAVIVQIAEVHEWWPDGGTKYEAIARIQKRLHDHHPYYFMPSQRSAVGPTLPPTRRIETETEVPEEKEIPFER